MKTFFTFLSLAWAGIVVAQHQEIGEKPGTYKGNTIQIADTASILNAFKKGTIQGHFRYFFMNTINEGGLSDYFANAVGGGLKFETAIYHRFQIGISGFYVFNVGSSKLSDIDPITNQSNRYEIGLFDIEKPSNQKDIDRLEEFYLNYHFKSGHIGLGRLLLNTPFINLQDGRMCPTSVEGLTSDSKLGKKTRLQAGWLWNISPRSTTKWYGIGESIGLYPQGVSKSGIKSDYAGNLRTKNVFFLGTNSQFYKWLNIQLGDLYVDEVLNSAFVQVEAKKTFNDQQSMTVGAQFIRQDAVDYGGNKDQSKTYMNHDSHSMVFGGKVEYKHKKSTFSVNYTRITADGRYLMPREWGRDPFYTFMPRERNEGFGDVHALVVKYNRPFPKSRLKIGLSAGYFDMPDVKNVALNKYGMPSYFQANADIRYSFSKILEGLDAQLLVISKFNNGNYYDNYRYIINKTNMIQFDLVLNYHF